MKKVRSKLRPTEIGVIKTFSLSPKDEIGEIAVECSGCTYYYNNLAELCEKWEDYEEPKGMKWANVLGANDGKVIIQYSNEEEAKQAVEKLKAWKRLKGGGFGFMSCSYGHDKTTDDTGGWIRFRVNHLYDDRYGCEVEKDLDLLFGGEE